MDPRLWHRVLLGLALCGCNHREPPPEPPFPSRPPAAASQATEKRALADAALDAGAPSSAVASAVSSAVAGLRERSLLLEPRTAPSERIVFGKGRVAQLRDNELCVYSTDGTLVVRTPVQAPRVVVELADGSLLAADREHLYLLGVGSNKLETKPHLTLLFDSAVLADRRTSNQFWVLYPASPSIYHYDLTLDSGSLLSFKEFVELGPKLGGDRVGASLGLKDGSFALCAGHRIWRVYASGRAEAMELPDPDRAVTRLLATAKIGEIWALRSDGKADRLLLGPRLHRVAGVAFERPPFDVAANDSNLAVVDLEQRSGAGKTFGLTVYDLDGKKVLERPLPQPTGFAAEDWVRLVTRDEGVAISAYEPLVAVGGPGRIQVYNLKTGAVVLDK